MYSVYYISCPPRNIMESQVNLSEICYVVQYHLFFRLAIAYESYRCVKLIYYILQHWPINCKLAPPGRLSSIIRT